MSVEEPPNSCSGHGRSPMCCDSNSNVSSSHPLPFIFHFLCMTILRRERESTLTYMFTYSRALSKPASLSKRSRGNITPTRCSSPRPRTRLSWTLLAKARYSVTVTNTWRFASWTANEDEDEIRF